MWKEREGRAEWEGTSTHTFSDSTHVLLMYRDNVGGGESTPAKDVDQCHRRKESWLEREDQ